MRILNRDEFLKMPEGTLFSKGQPIYFNGLFVKGESMPNDFIYRDLIDWENTGSEDMVSRFYEMVDGKKSFPINEDYGRDGCFNKDDLFLIYEAEDLANLVATILTAMNLLQLKP